MPQTTSEQSTQSTVGYMIDMYNENTYFKVFEPLYINKAEEKVSESIEINYDECMANCHVFFTFSSIGTGMVDSVALELQNKNTDGWIEICRVIPKQSDVAYSIDRHIKVGTGVKLRAKWNSGGGGSLGSARFDCVLYRQGEKFTDNGKTYILNIKKDAWESDIKEITFTSDKDTAAIIDANGLYRITDNTPKKEDKTTNDNGNNVHL